MRESLYHPEYGYYSRCGAQRFGDYYTSVDVHPIFGRLLARQLAEMWILLGSPRRFAAVEAGAGVGRLAAHLLDFAARELPDFIPLSIILQWNVRLRGERNKRAPVIARFRWPCGEFEKIPGSLSVGCIFSNELLDALPTHRVLMERGRLREYR